MIHGQKDKNTGLHGLLLLCWIAIGIGLRFINLGAKSPSSIEISTLGFSLGNGFLGIPLEQIISLDTLLSPLQYSPTKGINDVIDTLMSESTHPPLYFVLTHFWLKLFSPQGEVATLWVARSLSAILGAASIPAMFGLGVLAFRSRLVGQMTAALMAVSPYGIYLAQEARHYTLCILWIIASLGCLVIALRCILDQISPPIWICCVWVIVNSLGIATHYFFALVLGAEGLMLIGLKVTGYRLISNLQPSTYWRRIYAVALGTLIGCLIWLPALQKVPENELTNWIETSFDFSELWEPILRLLVWGITMVFLLPVEGTSLVVTVISAVVLLLVLLWVLPAIIRGIRLQMNSLSSHLSLWIISGFLLSAIAIFLLIIYGYRRDLSQAARYHFVYFPALIVLLGTTLAIDWQNGKQKAENKFIFHSFFLNAAGKKVVIVVLLMGLLGAFTVVSNYGFQKSRRSDLLAAHIQATSKVPILIAMTYETHAELRALMELAFDFKRLKAQNPNVLGNFNYPQFLLIKKQKDNTEVTVATQKKIISLVSRPLDLWGVNLKVDSEELEKLGCPKSIQSQPNINGYRYRLYHCHT